jgi:hypothetical protein
MSVIDDLADASIQGRSLSETAAMVDPGLDAADVSRALECVLHDDEARAYHLLFAVRRSAPDRAAMIPAERSVSIIISALTRLIYLNDFGYLAAGGSYDGEAAAALLETGEAAIPALCGLLDDDRPAPLFGSEEATLSTLYGYRRKDFAAYLLSNLLGEHTSFEADPADRDARIEALRARCS